MNGGGDQLLARPGLAVIRTLALDAAIWGSTLSTFCIAGELPTRLLKL